MELVGLAVAAVLLILPLLSFVMAVSARSRVNKVEQDLASAARRLGEAVRALEQLRREVGVGYAKAAEPQVQLPTPRIVTAPSLPVAEAAVSESVRPHPGDVPLRAGPPAQAVSAPVAVAEPVVAEVPAAQPAQAAIPPAAVAPVVVELATAAATAAAEHPAPVQPPAPGGGPAVATAPASGQGQAVRPTSPAFDWEGQIGVKLFSWVAGIALVFATVLFLRYSIERGWLEPPIRMAIGVAVGVVLLILCELKVARSYAVTANAMDGAGIAILFATFFAGHAAWHIVPFLPTFLLMALVTAVAVILSIRRDAAFIALLGMAGGFATPALLSTGLDNPVGLFGYLLLLNAGLAWLARRRGWAWLTALSVAVTAVYQWSWVTQRLSAESVPLSVAIFLAFPVVAFGGMLVRRQVEEGSDSSLVASAGLSGVLPLAFAVYLAAVPVYGGQWLMLFGFLFLLDAGLLAVALWQGRAGLHLGAGAGTLLVFAVHLFATYSSDEWPQVLAVLAVFVALYLLAPLLAERLRRPLGEPGERATLVGPLLLGALVVLLAREPACAEPTLCFLVLAGLIVGCALVAAWRAHLAVYATAAMIAIGAEIVWMWKHLAPENVVAGVVWLAGLALLALALPTLARRAGRAIPAGAQPLYLALAGPGLLLAVSAHPALAVPPGALLGALAVVVLAVGVTAVSWREGRLFVAAVALTVANLLALAGVSEVEPWPLIALLGAAGLAALAVGWIDVARSGAGEGYAADLGAYVSGAVVALMGGHLVGIGAGAAPDSPDLVLLICAHLAFASGLLWLAARFGWHKLPVIAVLPTAWAAAAWGFAGQAAHDLWLPRLAFAAAMVLPFLVFPQLLGRRVGSRIEPYGAAVLATGPCLLLGRRCLIDGNLRTIVGLLPVALGLGLLLLLLRLLRLEPSGQRQAGRLALVAGAALAMLTVAIPMQLDKHWITVSWALEGAALAWLHRRVRHRGLVIVSACLLGTVFVRLALNPAVLGYYPRSATPVLNWYLYTYLVCAAACFLAARLLAQTEARAWSTGPRLGSALPALGTILLFVLLNIEIADCFSDGRVLSFAFTGGQSLAQNLSYTLGWAFFAICLLIAGVIVSSRPARVTAIVLLATTVVKAFLFDLSSLSGLYRIASFVGLAISLLAVAVLLQRFVLARGRSQTPLVEKP